MTWSSFQEMSGHMTLLWFQQGFSPHPYQHTKFSINIFLRLSFAVRWLSWNFPLYIDILCKNIRFGVDGPDDWTNNVTELWVCITNYSFSCLFLKYLPRGNWAHGVILNTRNDWSNYFTTTAQIFCNCHLDELKKCYVPFCSTYQRDKYSSRFWHFWLHFKLSLLLSSVHKQILRSV
jgi:hypothetical protein